MINCVEIHEVYKEWIVEVSIHQDFSRGKAVIGQIRQYKHAGTYLWRKESDGSFYFSDEGASTKIPASVKQFVKRVLRHGVPDWVRLKVMRARRLNAEWQKPASVS